MRAIIFLRLDKLPNYVSKGNIINKNCQVTDLKDILNSKPQFDIEKAIIELIRMQSERNILLNIQNGLNNVRKNITDKNMK